MIKVAATALVSKEIDTPTRISEYLTTAPKIDFVDYSRLRTIEPSILETPGFGDFTQEKISRTVRQFTKEKIQGKMALATPDGALTYSGYRDSDTADYIAYNHGVSREHVRSTYARSAGRSCDELNRGFLERTERLAKDKDNAFTAQLLHREAVIRLYGRDLENTFDIPLTPDTREQCYRSLYAIHNASHLNERLAEMRDGMQYLSDCSGLSREERASLACQSVSESKDGWYTDALKRMTRTYLRQKERLAAAANEAGPAFENQGLGTNIPPRIVAAGVTSTTSTPTLASRLERLLSFQYPERDNARFAQVVAKGLAAEFGSARPRWSDNALMYGLSSFGWPLDAADGSKTLPMLVRYLRENTSTFKKAAEGYDSLEREQVK